MAAYLDAAAALVTNHPTWADAISDPALTPNQKQALRSLRTTASRYISSPSNTDRGTLASTLGTYAEHGNKDFAHWRAWTLVGEAHRAFATIPPDDVNDASQIATGLVESLTAEVDRKCEAWREKREELLGLMRLYSPTHARGHLTITGITAVILRECGALEHTKARQKVHVTWAIEHAVKRYKQRHEIQTNP